MGGAWYMAGNDLISLSNKEIIQCDYETGDGNKGCQGGTSSRAYLWVIQHGGLNSWDAYPYTSIHTFETGTCNETKASVNVASIDGVMWVSEHHSVDEHLAKHATAMVGPLTVAVNATFLQTYKSGILDPSDCVDHPDHVVAIVGYGDQHGKKYWKVKNSWGTKWGEEGYFRIARGSNMCGIMNDVVVGYKS